MIRKNVKEKKRQVQNEEDKKQTKKKNMKMKKAKDTTAPKASFAAGLIMAPRPLDCIHVPVMNAP